MAKTREIVRQIDEAGRIVMPKTFREFLDLRERDDVLMSLKGDTVVLSKHKATCTFCNSRENVFEFREYPVCEGCAAELGRKLEV